MWFSVLKTFLASLNQLVSKAALYLLGRKKEQADALIEQNKKLKAYNAINIRPVTPKRDLLNRLRSK